MKTQIFTLLFFLVICAVPCLSQTISYYYDQAGNRVERVIVLSAKMQADELDEQEEAKENPIIDRLQDLEIQIYPNPTRGLVSIEIPEPEKLSKGVITVRNAAKQVLFQTQINSGTFQIDLSRYSAGFYMMTIQCNGEIASWKIVKL